METVFQRLIKTVDGRKCYQQERLILEITEKICEIMKEEKVTRLELAHRLGKTKDFVTQFLDGEVKMTIRTVADVFTALNREIEVSVKELIFEEEKETNE